jgi:hypothetical protein
MCLRWTAAGMLEAEGQFRKVIGYRQLGKLAIAIERDLATSTTPEEVVSWWRIRLVPAPFVLAWRTRRQQTPSLDAVCVYRYKNACKRRLNTGPHAPLEKWPTACGAWHRRPG